MMLLRDENLPDDEKDSIDLVLMICGVTPLAIAILLERGVHPFTCMRAFYRSALSDIRSVKNAVARRMKVEDGNGAEQEPHNKQQGVEEQDKQQGIVEQDKQQSIEELQDGATKTIGMLAF